MEFIQQFLGDEFLSKAFILSLLGGAAVSLRGLPMAIWNKIKRYIVFSVTIEQTDELFDYVERWLVDHYSNKYRNVLAHVNYQNFAIDGHSGGVEVPHSEESGRKEKKEKVSYRHNQDVIFIRRKGIFIRISKGRDKIEIAKSLRDLYFDKYHLSTFFFKKKLQAFISDVSEYNQQFKEAKDGISVYISDNYGHFEKTRGINSKKMDSIVMDEKDKTGIISDIDRFLDSKKWYTSRSIPYKRGYLFYGVPGNGKTSMALALASYAKRDIYSITLSEIENDSSLKRAFGRASENAVMLIEDVDAVFSKRKSKDGISFSSLLNCLDGIFYKEGLITVLTTNHPEKLDPALVRDGRVDMKIEFDNPKEKEIRKYVELFYGIRLNGEVYGGKKMSMAKIQGHCMRKSEDQIREFLFKEQAITEMK